MVRMNGVHIMLEMLAGCGVQYLFGNPGTTELPISDAMAGERRIQYILGLQELPTVAIADGYAQASGKLGVVNLHICCGLGNAMGMIYNAHREGTPLLITAGQQDQRMLFEEPILWGRMIDVVRPWTKWAEEIRRVQDLPSAVRRAVQTAMAPPRGPVFLALPLDVQMAMAEEVLDLTPPRLPDFKVRAPIESLRQAAAVLANARNPGILAGSRICEADAVAELVEVAERIGAPVMHEATTSHGRCSFPSDHPLASAQLPFWSPEVRQRLAEFDVLLVAGMKLMQQYIYHQPRPIPEHIRLVHIDDDPWELNKNYPIRSWCDRASPAGVGRIGRFVGRNHDARATPRCQNPIGISRPKAQEGVRGIAPRGRRSARLPAHGADLSDGNHRQNFARRCGDCRRSPDYNHGRIF